MKKKVLFVAALFIGATTFAQDGLTSKKGEAYLPEAGDYAIGFDGTPFLDYAGNLLNGATGNTLNATWVSSGQPMTIVGKMFKDENTAYRGKVRIGFGSSSIDNLVDTNTSAFSGPSYITNTSSTSNFNLTLGGGIEKRRGSTRIQGFYGAEALISFGSTGTSEEYGIDLSATNTNGGAARVTSTSAGASFTFGARAFAGVEWFVAPKVSLAAEYGWGLAFTTQGGGETKTERWGPASAGAADSVIEEVAETGGSGSFGIDTDNNGGTISIFFHF